MPDQYTVSENACADARVYFTVGKIPGRLTMLSRSSIEHLLNSSFVAEIEDIHTHSSFTTVYNSKKLVKAAARTERTPAQG